MMINRLAWQAFQYSGLVSYLMNISLPWAKLCGVVEWRECGGSKYGWWWWCSGWWPMWRPALWTPCPCWACKLVTEPVRLAMLELLLLEFGWDEPTSAWVVPSFCNLGFRGPRSCCTAKNVQNYSISNGFVKSQFPWVKLLVGPKKGQWTATFTFYYFSKIKTKLGIFHQLPSQYLNSVTWPFINQLITFFLLFSKSSRKLKLQKDSEMNQPMPEKYRLFAIWDCVDPAHVAKLKEKINILYNSKASVAV